MKGIAMVEITRSTWASITLVAMGLLCGGLWRAEVAWHGWTGLAWLGYYHLAVPISVILFLVWLAAFSSATPAWKKVVFLASAVLVAVVLHVVVPFALYFHFVCGPTSMPALLINGPDRMSALGRIIYFVYPGVPVVAWGIARLFGVRASLGRLALSVGVFLLAQPVARLALELTGHVGGSDSIHAIKSGFIVPLLVMGLGIIFLPFPRLDESGARPDGVVGTTVRQ